MRRTHPAILALGLLLPACTSDPTGIPVASSAPVQVFSVDVDTDERLESDPGKGVGVYAEYAAGGEWHVWMTCDTDASGYTCGWDIVASLTPSQTLEVVDETELEKPDEILRVDPGAVRLLVETESDVDGVRLQAPPGEPLTLDLEWDGDSPPAGLVSWFGGGAVHTGAPSNPVQLTPTLP